MIFGIIRDQIAGYFTTALHDSVTETVQNFEYELETHVRNNIPIPEAIERQHRKTVKKLYLKYQKYELIIALQTKVKKWEKERTLKEDIRLFMKWAILIILALAISSPIMFVVYKIFFFTNDLDDSFMNWIRSLFS
jgi:hypothetical protein